jgi:omega-6 fatty acid desaturase (delta-12 desaturase)
MPRILQWFTGNIGFHHIHHLCSMIPNYRLEECLATSPELQQTNRLTLRDSFRCIPLTLWDEDRQRLVSFREAAAGGPAASGNDARDSVGIVA